MVGAAIIDFALFQHAGMVGMSDYNSAIMLFAGFAIFGLSIWGCYEFSKRDKIERATSFLMVGTVVVVNIMLMLPDGLTNFYPYTFLLVVVISGFLISPIMAFIMTAVCITSSFLTVSFYWGVGSTYFQWLTMPALLSILVALITWDQAHNLITAYNWAVASQAKSRRRRDELFDSQQQIKKTNNLLAAANLRLAENQRELEKARAELEVLVADLQKLNASKDKFFSIVAHDLKGPFQPLLGLSELIPIMVDSGSPQEIKEMGESINRSAKNVYTLLENLLQWSRLQMGRMEYAPTRLKLREIAAGTINLLNDFATTKGVHLVNTAPNYIFVYADENMLHTILRNLTSNAIKFTRPQGAVTISARRIEDADQANSFIEASVADTGVGISPENAAKLFKIDEHITTLGTAKEQGTGLGLILCREMVEKNGGRIWVESVVGQGSTFRFTIPLNQSDPLPSLENIVTDIAEVKPTENNNLPPAAEPEPEKMIVPPAVEMGNLMNLALLGDMQGVEDWVARIEQLDEEYIPFTTSLRKLAKNFEDEAIISLVETYMNKSAS